MMSAYETRTLTSKSMKSVMRGRQIAASIVVLLACALGALAQTAASRTPGRFSGVIARTLADGRNAVLPPHISHLLGISPAEKEVPVKQFVEMKENTRGLEVGSLQRGDVVLFVEDRASHDTMFYLTSPSGKLRRVLAVRAGVGYERAPTEADRKVFEKEKTYWVGRLGAGKP
jgi:hypothetical protein